MSTKDKDTLHSDLDALEAHYRATGPEEPPAMLDQAVLNRARRAAEKHAERPWNFGWMHATATAALVVLGLTLVLQLRESTEQSPGLSNQPIELRKVPGNEALQRQDRERDAPEDFRRQEAEELKASQARQKSELMDELREENLRQAVPANLEPAQTVAPPPGAQSADAHGRAATPTEPEQDSAAGEGAASRFRAQAPAAAEADEMETVSTLSLNYDNPGDWLARIIDLKQAGEQAWHSELAAFIEAYPDYPLPDDLAAAVAKNPEPK